MRQSCPAISGRMNCRERLEKLSFKIRSLFTEIFEMVVSLCGSGAVNPSRIERACETHSTHGCSSVSSASVSAPVYTSQFNKKLKIQSVSSERTRENAARENAARVFSRVRAFLSLRFARLFSHFDLHDSARAAELPRLFSLHQPNLIHGVWRCRPRPSAAASATSKLVLGGSGGGRPPRRRLPRRSPRRPGSHFAGCSVDSQDDARGRAGWVA